MSQKPVFMSICLSLIIPLTLSCSNNKKATSTTQNSSVEQANGSTQKLSLKVTAPEGWSPNSSNPSMIMKGTGSYIITTDVLPEEAATPDAYAKFAQKQFEQAFANTKFQAPQSLSISGTDARRLEFSGEISGMKMNYIIVSVLKDGMAYTLTCGDLTSDFDAVKADFEKIIASARLE